ncbi:hypothetical protein BPAE_0156g00220 [Botrytis paeoniae]|uniref:Uncharacterized protein n=1 Tax=Botrytis paeoniae TaxID=278948 RepID=A0A4Z1FDU2_9HELO|nr:hypothetical protein BPAE_0156g00220 [Botrytis paeoniae]
MAKKSEKLRYQRRADTARAKQVSLGALPLQQQHQRSLRQLERILDPRMLNSYAFEVNAVVILRSISVQGLPFSIAAAALNYGNTTNISMLHSVSAFC